MSIPDRRTRHADEGSSACCPSPRTSARRCRFPPTWLRRKAAFDAEVARIFYGRGPAQAPHHRPLLGGPRGLGPRLHGAPRRHRPRGQREDRHHPARLHQQAPHQGQRATRGLLHNPDPEAPDDLLEGVKAIRRMHLRVIEETGMFHRRRDALPHQLPVPDRPAVLRCGGRALRREPGAPPRRLGQ